MHTGGQPRDTCWPLVRSVLKQALPGSRGLFEKVLIRLQCKLLRFKVKRLDGADEAKEFWGAADEVFAMLQATVTLVAEMIDRGYASSHLEQECVQWREDIDACVRRWSDHPQRSFELPDREMLESISSSSQFPTLQPPEPHDLLTAQCTYKSGREKALAENRGYEVVDASICSTKVLLLYLRMASTSGVEDQLNVAHRMVVLFMCRVAEDLGSEDPVTSCDPPALLEITNWYRGQSAKFAVVRKYDQLARVTTCSQVLLVSWIAFCLCHKHCCHSYTWFKKHHIPLDWKRLNIAVLAEKGSRAALQQVAAYIRQWNTQAGLLPSVFNFSDPQGSILLARTMGQHLSAYPTMHQRHLARKNSQITVLWANIETRKRRVASLRGDIADLKPRLARAQADLAEEECSVARKKSWGGYARRTHLNELEERVSKLSRSISDMEDERDRLLKLHEFYVSPLPADNIEALAVLFLNYLPPHVDILSELSGLAQRALGLDDSTKYRVSPPCETSWAAHIAAFGQGCFTDAPTKYISEYPRELKVPSRYGPSSIDDVFSKENFARVCSWYPVGNSNVIMWQDRFKSPGSFVDPFKIPESDSFVQFTPVLSPATGVEWSVAYPGGSTRGNLTYAKSRVVTTANDDFAAYVALGSLRCYPIQQLRRLFGAIQTNFLDWSAHVVAVVVKQAAFQVGSLTDDSLPLLEWHTDLDRLKSLEQFCTMIETLARRVDSSPSTWKCVPLLGELAGFLDQFRCGGRQGVRSLSGTARRWAQEDRQKWLGGVSTDERIELRTRECLLYGFALVCFSFGPCGEEDLQSLSELIILFANAALFATGNTLRHDVREVEHVVRRVMSTRIVAIVEHVAGAQSQRLSHLCALVNDRVPNDLQWSSVATGGVRLSCCFEAIDAVRGVHYLVNMFTGSILTNGMPPGGLPVSMRQHSTFVMLFGDQDFEVIRHEDVYSTAQKLGDCAYTFRLVGEELCIEETSSMAQLQFCPTEWLAKFSSVFPATLSSLYSHSYWEDQECVLLRQKFASEREVIFVMKFNDGHAQCYEVARCERDLNYVDIVSRAETYNVLINHDESTSRVFSKLESLSFVHSLISPAKRLDICLPRFGLRFKQNDHGQLASSEYRGYCLSKNQRLSGQLHRFERYLVLECTMGTCEKVPRRLLIPRGRVVDHPSGKVDIQLSTSPGASLPICVMEEHPRLLTFSTESLENQLLLAAIYSACDNIVPWQALCRTAGQASNELLRGSTSSRPFSEVSTQALRDVCGSSHLTTSSKLKVKELTTGSTRQSFLFPAAAVVGPVVADAASEMDGYAAACRCTSVSGCHCGSALTFAEECTTLGSSVLRTSLTSVRDSLRSPTELRKLHLKSDYVRVVESSLLQLVRTPRRKPAPSFPLATSALNLLGKHMVEELETSWIVFQQAAQQTLSVDLSALAANCRVQLHDVARKRGLVWKYLSDAVDAARNTSKDKVSTAAGFLLPLTMTDILRSVVDKASLLHFTATLSTQGRGRFKRAALRFMELCVLEDKLERIISRAEATSPPPTEYFVEELTCVRQWKAEEHPYWLVFEVEGRLQIRPEQYIVAQHLIENPGSICQLNMGRGKTRVILPMLFVYYRYAAAGRVVRAHFLSPLLSETRQFMHRVLSSGSLRLPFVELPFNRTIALGLREVLKMQEVVDEVKKSGGFLIVAPEHRLSLELKRLEIEQSGIEGKEAICGALDALLQGSQYIDIFDESDALLHHKYHLVYAVGSPEILDGGSARWIVAEALLRVLTSASSKRVTAVLNKFTDLFSVRAEYAQRCGGYNGFTLSTAIEAAASSRIELKKALIEDLIDNAPFDLSWLKVMGGRNRGIRANLITALSDCQVECDQVLSALPIHLDGVKDQFLALRGLVAYGVLETCLEKRNRVTYGLPDAGTRKKALAIPFTAADLPAERSEFSHPDVSIVLTLLAYYHAGLTETEVRKAFVLLLRLDVSERKQYYSEWFKSVEAKIGSEHRITFGELDHVSLDNAHQFAILVKVYQFSTEVINFYLNRHVFPRDTKQYPQRLSRTAWDLVRGPTNIGFSGTNDTHRLLPVGVTQREPNLASLRGTNGKMIDLLLTSTIGYEAVGTSSVSNDVSSVPTWQLLLLQALEKDCRALIDTGALLAGVALEGAARFLIEQPEFSAAGVTYYDSRKVFDCWVVLERSHLLTRPLKTSSVHERDTFVIFDEARSRGSDMKLRPEAVALLTLGPTITKDKLMQGAGRLRQLGQNQKLWLSSMDEVQQILLQRRESNAQGVNLGILNQLQKWSPKAAPSVADSSSIGIVDILGWVMQNTQHQSTTGLLEWAHSGIQFCAKLECEDKELQDEDWTLERLYEDAVADIVMYDVISRQLQATAIVEDVAASAAASEIDARAQTYGREDTVRVTGFGEECERELQIEEEEEVEQELPPLELQPRADTRWDYRALLSVSDVSALRRIVTIKSAQDALRELVSPQAFCDIDWASAKVYGTANFWATVLPPPEANFVWTGVLRIADAMITFSDGSVVLLSEREADAVLKLLLVTQRGDDTATRRGRFGLVHLGFAARAITSDSDLTVPLTKIPLSLGFDIGERRIPRGMKMSVVSMVASQLLNGDTQFASRTHAPLMERVLRGLLRRLPKREETLRGFVEARRMAERWSLSFLQDVAKRMDLEDHVQ